MHDFSLSVLQRQTDVLFDSSPVTPVPVAINHRNRNVPDRQFSEAFREQSVRRRQGAQLKLSSVLQMLQNGEHGILAAIERRVLEENRDSLHNEGLLESWNTSTKRKRVHLLVNTLACASCWYRFAQRVCHAGQSDASVS